MKETMLNCFESWKMSNQWYANEICGKKNHALLKYAINYHLVPAQEGLLWGINFFFFLELLVYLNYWNDDRIWNELRLSLKRSESRIKLSRPLSVAKKKKGERKKEKEYCPSHQTSSPFKSVLSEIFLLIWQKPNNSQHIHDMSKEQNQWPHWPART